MKHKNREKDEKIAQGKAVEKLKRHGANKCKRDSKCKAANSARKEEVNHGRKCQWKKDKTSTKE
jgi:hypothetical protein